MPCYFTKMSLHFTLAVDIYPLGHSIEMWPKPSSNGYCARRWDFMGWILPVRGSSLGILSLILTPTLNKLDFSFQLFFFFLIS